MIYTFKFKIFFLHIFHHAGAASSSSSLKESQTEDTPAPEPPSTSATTASSRKKEDAPSTSTASSSHSSVAVRQDTLKAEILWCFKVVEDHQSFHSCQGNNELFRRMFPDSSIAKDFKLSESKCKYMTVFGLGPFVQGILKDYIKKSCSHYVILFDESLNKPLQSKQMDFLIRLWQNNEVNTRYLSSVFIGHGTALHLKHELMEVLQTVGLKKLAQISMDGPNVNWRMYEDFTKEYKTDLKQDVLNLGSCGLHIVNGAFLTGAKAAAWDVESFLSSLYFLFNDAPARREDFQTVTGAADMPLKFCKTRWLENVPVAERALALWDNILKYVKAVEEKKIPNPKNKSFETVQKCSKVLLFPARLCFFISVAKVVNPYLTLYQTDAPMLPFLSTDLTKMLSTLMKRFLKLDKATAKSAYLLMKLKLDDQSIHEQLAKIDIGFYTEMKVKDLKKKVSERMVLEFRADCKSFLLAMSRKLLEKCPLKYALVRNLGCLDPRIMAREKEKATTQMKRVVTILNDANRIEGSCEDVLSQYSDACDAAATDPTMRDFDYNTARVDTVMFTFFTKKPALSSVWNVVSMCMIFSHGQASVERGFSINRQMEQDNLQSQSLVSLRSVYDYIKHVGGISNITVNNAMLLSASAGRQRYHAYLEDQKKQEEKDKKDNKRKSILDELEELKAKRARLQKDIKCLTQSADEFADKAESTGQITLITKSNSLRRTAKEKTSQVEKVEKDINKKLNSLRSS